jgi:hypothetical protein
MQTIFSIHMLKMHNIPAAFLTISLITATGAESLPCMRCSSLSRQLCGVVKGNAACVAGG